MTTASGNEQRISRLQSARLAFSRQLQARGTLQQDDPFRLSLIIPEIRRARVASRNNPLHPQISSAQQKIDPFSGEMLWKIRQ
jgi:hypothetical protein